MTVYVKDGRWWVLECPAGAEDSGDSSGRMERSRRVRKHPTTPNPAQLDVTEEQG